MRTPILSETCDETAIEEFVNDFTNHAGKYGIYHDIMDITVIPMVPVLNPQQLAQMNGAQREGEKLRHILYADHTQGMKSATADLHQAVRGNTRARNALEAQRRLLNLPNGQNPHIVLMLQELRNVFNPISIINAGDKEDDISKMRLAVGAPMFGFAQHMEQEFEMLGHLRTQPVGIDERRRVFMKALRNKEEGMKTCITNLFLTIDILN